MQLGYPGTRKPG